MRDGQLANGGYRSCACYRAGKGKASMSRCALTGYADPCLFNTPGAAIWDEIYEDLDCESSIDPKSVRTGES